MYFDRFDIVEAHYAFACDWYNGQACPLYARLSRIVGALRFKPSPLFKGYDSLTENGQEIYNSLKTKHGFA
jgi:hypothetical protein